MSNDTALTIAGIGIALAVPATFMFANYIRKNVDYGEAQFRTKPEDSDDQDEA
ncbi:glutamyl-tRNA amidotransferase [Altererythrobacter lutimaris]|uniref:glutamyl-tRNA amidotransferase n=1 Tax=Altererythrobacter lutimaris TaxID=2743979 RepID=UPI002FC31455